MPNLFESAADLNGYLFRILDNGGATADRYTVAFSDGSYLGLSGAPSHPQGFSQWGENFDPVWAAKAVDRGKEINLALGDLPPHIAQHILARCNGAWRDCLERLESGDTPARRKDAEINGGGWRDGGKGVYRMSGGWYVRWDEGHDRRPGPFETAREALLATLPDEYSLSGPEYHSTLDVMRLTPDPEVLAAVKALEARVDADRNAGEVK